MLRYSLTWEDAGVLLPALDAPPGGTLVSIAGAGDNVLALLLTDPAKVVAVDYNPAQLAALALRIAAYKTLDHGGLLELLGVLPSPRRPGLYRACRSHLPAFAQAYWDARPAEIAAGIGQNGRFERYLTRFRRYVLPLIHRRRTVERLLTPMPETDRTRFYDAVWDTRLWRGLFRLFCSRTAMRTGRDAAYLAHAEGNLADRLRVRARHACTHLDPSKNPYLRWILTGTYGNHLPLALQERHFETIRARAHRIDLSCGDLHGVLRSMPAASADGFNLSDVFEYLDEQACASLYDEIARVARPAARLAYWNLFVPRTRPASMAHALQPIAGEAAALHRQDRAFFYGGFVVEQRRAVGEQARRAA